MWYIRDSLDWGLILGFYFWSRVIIEPKTFPIKFFGYGFLDGECFTSIEAHFNYGSFDPCASVNIPDFMDFIAQRKKLWSSQNYAWKEGNWLEGRIDNWLLQCINTCNSHYGTYACKIAYPNNLGKKSCQWYGIGGSCNCYGISKKESREKKEFAEICPSITNWKPWHWINSE